MTTRWEKNELRHQSVDASVSYDHMAAIQVVNKDIGLGEGKSMMSVETHSHRGHGKSYWVDGNVHHVVSMEMLESLANFNQLGGMVN